MRGFVYLIEVAIAGLLVALALGAFLATTTIKTDWSRPDLIALGDSALWSLAAADQTTNVLSGNTANITAALPPNVRWALAVAGTPKTKINVGCVCDWGNWTKVDGLLERTLLNDRWIEFNVTRIPTWPADVAGYDALVFTNVIGFDTDADAQMWLASGRGIVALFNINDMPTLSGMAVTFGLTSSYPSAPPTLPFVSYAPAVSAVPKYFFGFGMPVATPYATPDNKMQGSWSILGSIAQINITAANLVEIQYASPGTVAEGGTFQLSLPIGTYAFSVKKILPARAGVIFQPIAPAFNFSNFAADDGLAVRATKTDIIGDGIVSATAANGSAVWVSDFADSSEYSTLLRAAVATLVTEWWVAEPVSPREPATVASFVPMCCDTPESVQLVLWLWYAF